MSELLVEQSCVDVVKEPADLDRLGDQRMRAHFRDVVIECFDLVGNDAEGMPTGVLAEA